MSGCSLAQGLTRNTQRLGPIPTPLCLGQEAQLDWHTRLNYELISLLSQYNLNWKKIGSPHELAPDTDEMHCEGYNWRLSGTAAWRLG
jgi:hypothetical protein